MTCLCVPYLMSPWRTPVLCGQINDSVIPKGISDLRPSAPSLPLKIWGVLRYDSQTKMGLGLSGNLLTLIVITTEANSSVGTSFQNSTRVRPIRCKYSQIRHASVENGVVKYT